ncbi:CHASE3 domain-containing protein [Paenibacillus sp. N3/727]|uniref:CHASE3 domain-containing protein n=1 Tax=Paenibacillus sp. N3/727 TaxID=2925845 RepID=UPI001F52F210|nr:CHASE3 domain-containing protein [Paenibacillus sp. N3/727]UNK16572.1 CHASE3 domain-containing protein [Paenibacillus sp. N3/727]
MPNSLKIKIRTKIIFGYVLVLLCLGVFLWVVSGRLTSLQQEADFIEQHDIEVNSLTHEIEKNMLELETGQRGFVITGDPVYLEPFEMALSTWEMNYNKLHQLIADNATQLTNLSNIKDNINKWIEVAGQPAVRIKQAGQDEEALQFFIDDPGQQAMNMIRSQFTEFRDAERQLTSQRIDDMKNSNTNLLISMYSLWAAVALATILAAIVISKSIVRPIRQVTEMISSIADGVADGGNLSRRIKVNTRDEVLDLAENTNKLLTNVSRQAWVKDQVTVMSTLLQSADRLDTLSRFFIHKAAGVMSVPYAALFINRNDTELVKAAAFADPDGEPWDKVRDRFSPGEGLVGQCMIEKRIIQFDDIPPNYVRIESGLGDAEPSSLVVAPVMFEGRVLSVIELAMFKPMDDEKRQLLEQLLQVLGVALNSMLNKMEIQQLYRESQALNEELQVQSEELQAQTEELQAQTEELQMHASESQVLNERLEAQKDAAEQAAKELEKYAEQVEQSSTYKSQFLANMSHELRTPLNSMLILSQILSENKEGHLTEEERNYASVIHKSGSELLNLINDILDLSKVEAGKMVIEVDLVNLTELPEIMRGYFDKSAESKQLRFEIEMDPTVPDIIYSDGMRLHQIIRNLLSNAIKFTDEGKVKLSIGKVDSMNKDDYCSEKEMITFTVEDTGIGISDENLKPIFEAFRQGDGATARKFGGTGLGLSISLQLARLLGGHISVESKERVGSKFTLYLPANTDGDHNESLFVVPEVAATIEKNPRWNINSLLEDDVQEWDETLQLEGVTVLLVDDDIRNVYGLTNAFEKRNMKVLTAQNGYECLEILDMEQNIDVVLLDIMMPEMDGYETMKRIRENPVLQSLPIIVLTAKAMKEDKDKCLAAGASGYFSKPVQLSDVIAAIQVSLMDVKHE